VFSLLQVGSAQAAPNGIAAPSTPATSVDRTARAEQPFTLGTFDDCQTVEAKIKNRTTGVKGNVACIFQQSLKERSTPGGVVQVPEWCAPNKVILTRKEACGMGRFGIRIINNETNVTTGGMDVNQLGYMFTNRDLIDWQYQATQTFTNIWGTAIGTTVIGSGSCTGDCVASSQSWPAMIATQEALWEGYVVGESTTYQPGQIGSGVLDAQTTFTNPVWTRPISNSGPTPAVRCDNLLAGLPAGCVLPTVTPEMFYELSGPYPELALHVKEAQAKGLPGVLGGTPLTRTTDKVTQDRNNAVACPASLPRPPGTDCDEYPFRSTWEGAAFGPYDIKMIDSTQNQAGGNALQQFYYEERVLSHDPFWVTVV
jgi:hypothetical protein